MRAQIDLVRKAVSAWVDDRAPSMGAALSYYTVFSIAPLLLIVISVAGLVFGEEAARGAIVAQIQGLVGEQGAVAIEQLLRSVSEPKEGVLATVIGVVLLLVGATTVLAELQDDLDRIWKTPERNKPKGLWGWARARVLSFGLILGIGFLLLVSLAFSAAISALGSLAVGLPAGWEAFADGLNFILTYAIVTVLFAFLYRYLPMVHIRWRDVWVGAMVTAALFGVGKYLIGLYIGRSAVTSGFGAAGSLAVVLVWVYYSAQIFLLGAEFTSVYAREYGSRRGTVSQTEPHPALPRALDAPSPALAIGGPIRFAPLPSARDRRREARTFATGAAVGAVSGALIAACVLRSTVRKLGAASRQRPGNRPASYR